MLWRGKIICRLAKRLEAVPPIILTRSLQLDTLRQERLEREGFLLIVDLDNHMANLHYCFSLKNSTKTGACTFVFSMCVWPASVRYSAFGKAFASAWFAWRI